MRVKLNLAYVEIIERLIREAKFSDSNLPETNHKGYVMIREEAGQKLWLQMQQDLVNRKSSEQDLELGRLVRPSLNRNQPVYRWFVYPHSFTRELVHTILDDLDVREDAIVADPFVGAGTTLLACKERGLSAIGYDILPLSVLISNVKTRNYRFSALKRAWNFLNSGQWSTHATIRVPPIPILLKAFDPEVLERILVIRGRIQAVKNRKYSRLFLLGLLSVLGELSKTQKGGGWLRFIPEKLVTPQEVDPSFVHAVELMFSDLRTNPVVSPRKGHWAAYLADARALPGYEQFDGVVTSPPYLNRHDYTRIFSLELSIGFIRNEEQLKNLRYRTLRSHVEAHKWYNGNGYTPPECLVRVLRDLTSAPLNNDRILEMVEGYFEDIFYTLQALYSKVRENGFVTFVLGNVRFGGKIIPVDEIVAELGERAGFRWIKTMVARFRGNSAQQMGRFGRELSRESILVWRK